MVIQELRQQLDMSITDKDEQVSLITRLRDRVKNNQTQISNAYGLRERSREKLQQLNAERPRSIEKSHVTFQNGATNSFNLNNKSSREELNLENNGQLTSFENQNKGY